MRKIHGGFNQVGSEASSDEEEEEAEDAEDDDEDQQPAPASVINISIYNKKTQRNELSISCTTGFRNPRLFSHSWSSQEGRNQAADSYQTKVI